MNLEILKTDLKKTKQGFHHTCFRVCNNIPNEVRGFALLYHIKNNVIKILCLKTPFCAFF